MKLILAVLLILPFAIQTILPQEKSYLNLSLNDCITLAMENSKQKQIASTKIEVSKSHLKQAESGRWPSLELSSKAFIQDEPQNFIFPSSTFSFPPLEINLPPQDIKLLDNKSIMTDLTLVYPVFTGGKISSIIDQVEHSILISQNNLALTENEITLNVKKAYYAVILTQQLLKIGSDAFERFEATYHLTESLYQTGSGTVSKLDYLKNKMSLESFRGIVSELGSKNSVANSALKYYLGLSLSSEISIKDSSLEIEYLTPKEQETLNELLSTNLYLKNLDIATNIYNAKIDEAESDYYPSLALFGNYHRLDNSYDYGFATDKNKNVFTLGLGLQLSLFNGFRTAGKVEENEAELKGLQFQKVFVEESLKMKLTQLLTELKKSDDKIVSSKEAMIAASENRDLNLRAYQNEIGEVADFIEAQIMESIMMAQYQLALYERTELKSQLESLLNKTN
ncbi:MAG: TolC family protein [Ignavibacteriales bacterium]|nr:TolC family protein [Ignavibacteriales bacterium]